MVLPTKHADGDPNFYEMVITIDGSKVTTETGIPLMRNVNLPGVDSTGKDVRLEQLDGTPIAREIECVGVPNADDVAFHFPFDTTVSTDSQFVVKWGNTNLSEPAADSTYGSEAVWIGFNGVWHMTSVSSVTDSSGNGKTGTIIGNPTLVNDDYGKALSFDGVGDEVNFGVMSNQLNACLEIQHTFSDENEDTLAIARATNIDGMFQIGSTTSNTQFQILIWEGGTWRTNIISTNTKTTGEKLNTVFNVDSTNGVNLYSNGADDGSDASVVTLFPSNSPFILGSGYGGGFHSTTIVSEMRLSSVSRSSNYITTTHKNLNNPTTSGTAPFYLADGPIQHQRRVPQYI